MDFAFLSQSFRQILDIFGKTDISGGTVLKSPQENLPDKELVAEFEKYMQEPLPEQELSENSLHQAAVPPAGEIRDIQPNSGMEIPEIGHIEDIQNISVEPQEYLQEIQQIFTQIQNNGLTTSNLFRLQYLTNVLNVQVAQNNSLSKSSTEQFETILKQQG